MGTRLKGERGGGAQREESRSEKATFQENPGRLRRKEGGDTPPPVLNAEQRQKTSPRCVGREETGSAPRPLASPRPPCVFPVQAAPGDASCEGYFQSHSLLPRPLTRQPASSLQRATARGQPSTTHSNDGPSSSNTQESNATRVLRRVPLRFFLESRSFP